MNFVYIFVRGGGILSNLNGLISEAVVKLFLNTQNLIIFILIIRNQIAQTVINSGSSRKRISPKVLKCLSSTPMTKFSARQKFLLNSTLPIEAKDILETGVKFGDFSQFQRTDVRERSSLNRLQIKISTYKQK